MYIEELRKYTVNIWCSVHLSDALKAETREQPMIHALRIFASALVALAHARVMTNGNHIRATEAAAVQQRPCEMIRESALPAGASRLCGWNRFLEIFEKTQRRRLFFCSFVCMFVGLD